MRTEITIDGTDNNGANYLTWAPVHASIRLVDADAGDSTVEVVLQNQDTSQGGQLVFFDAVPGTEQDTLQLTLSADGTPVDFFVAGKFLHPSTADKDAVIEVVEASSPSATVLSTTSLMVRIRKNANNLTAAERDRFVAALAALNNTGMGSFRDFRDMHTRAASPEAHGDAGFLPWHRAYLLDLERELQNIDPSVALPYWKFDEPAPNLFTRMFIGVSIPPSTRVRFAPNNPLRFWVTDMRPGIDRAPSFDTTTSGAVDQFGQPVLDEANTLLLGQPGDLYENFINMEGDPHGAAHTCFGGFISSVPTAAKDPLFFLLHANVDRLWAKWQWFYKRFDSTDVATYPLPGKAGDPFAARVGHNLQDTMWPWNQDTSSPRPPTAPGGTFAPSPTANAPGLNPAVDDMIDFEGVTTLTKRLGFAYDDVPFEF